MNSYLEVKEKSYEIIEISEEGEEDDDKQETVEKNNKLKPLGKEENEKLYDKKIFMILRKEILEKKAKIFPLDRIKIMKIKIKMMKYLVKKRIKKILIKSSKSIIK